MEMISFHTSRRVKQFASEYRLTDRPHTTLWLTKACAIPASMYACQIWGTRFMKEGAEMDCPLQTESGDALYSSIGSVQQLGYTMLYCAATALCSARCCKRMLIIRLQGVWNADAFAELSERTNKLAKHHRWVALPLKPSSVHGTPFSVPRCLHLDLCEHMLRK
eukprot:1140457-Pelagomonas_calceolata.AAC.2